MSSSFFSKLGFGISFIYSFINYTVDSINKVIGIMNPTFSGPSSNNMTTSSHCQGIIHHMLFYDMIYDI